MDLNRDHFTDIQDFIILCTAIVTFLAAVYAARRQIIKPITKFLQREFKDAVNESVQPSLDRIEHEVTANDGSSLKDLVKRNHEQTLTLLDDRAKNFARLAHGGDKRLKKVEGQYDEILERLDALSTQSASDSAKVLNKLDPKE